ncbi:MAG: hypothetical protein ABSD97_15540, partial [Acidimicrobiales bacterium]
MGQLVRERFHPLRGRVRRLNPYAVIGMAAIAIRSTVEFVVLHRETVGLSNRFESGVETFGIATFEPVADGRELFAGGLRDVEYRHKLEASDDPIVPVVL